MLMIVRPARLGRPGSGELGQVGHFPQRRRVRLLRAPLARLTANVPMRMARLVKSTAFFAPVRGKATQRRLATKLALPSGSEAPLSIAAGFRLGARKALHA
jgi:hypothetical protein